MANKLTVTYNESNIVNGAEISGNAAVTYNGSTIVTVTAGQTKTLNCSGKAMATNVVIGGKTLNCSGKYMQSNVVVKVESLVPPLAQATWAQISEVSRSGQASQCWKVGDTRKLTLSGSTYTVQIVAFDHFNVNDASSYGRTKAGIVFQFKDTIPANLNFANTQSYAQDWVANYCDCSQYVVNVNYPVRSSANSLSATSTTKKGVSPSEMELSGSYSNEGTQIGTQLAFYAAGNSRVKTSNGSASKANWWTRSYSGTRGSGVYIDTSGAVRAGATSREYQCAAIFCV